MVKEIMIVIFGPDATQTHVEQVRQFLGIVGISLIEVNGLPGSWSSGRRRYKVPEARGREKDSMLAYQIGSMAGVESVEFATACEGAW